MLSSDGNVWWECAPFNFLESQQEALTALEKTC